MIRSWTSVGGLFALLLSMMILSTGRAQTTIAVADKAVCTAAHASAPPAAPVEVGALTPSEERIESELAKPTNLQFDETPLQDVVAYLTELHHIDIQIDSKPLSDEGVSVDTPITKTLKGVSLRSALKLILDDHDLTIVVVDDVLLITTKSRANQMVFVRVHDVTWSEGTQQDFDLSKVVCEALAPGGVEGNGGIGVTRLRFFLIVRGTYDQQGATRNLLVALRDRLYPPKEQASKQAATPEFR